MKANTAMQKHIKPACRLKVLHLRGRRRGGADIQRAEVDAKHAARSDSIPGCLKYIAVLVDHQRQLRAFRIHAKRPGDKQRFAVIERTREECETFVNVQ